MKMVSWRRICEKVCRRLFRIEEERKAILFSVVHFSGKKKKLPVVDITVLFWRGGGRWFLVLLLGDILMVLEEN